jgi:two-component SAPR family response regulator
MANQRNGTLYVGDDISVKKNRVEMENVLKINAGIACSDRANEVEPRPNGDK